jgi:UDP-N-acetylglucosamine/UDP-N-acetylgalactosamine diphosphorylase
MGYQEAYDKLKKYGQLHVLQYYEELSDVQKEALLAQIMDTDLSVLEQCRHKEELNPRGEITPIEVMKLSRIEERREEFVRTGLDAIRAGRVGAVMLAGGMGTRLGADVPKGTYNIERGLYFPAAGGESAGCGTPGRGMDPALCDDQ